MTARLDSVKTHSDSVRTDLDFFRTHYDSFKLSEVLLRLIHTLLTTRSDIEKLFQNLLRVIQISLLLTGQDPFRLISDRRSRGQILVIFPRYC